MTNKKAFLGISFAAAFAVSMIFAQNATADDPNEHLVIDEFNFETFEGFAKVDIKTDAPIPLSSGAFGYGVFTDPVFPHTNKVLGITGHICAADSFVQGNIPAEHKNCPFAPEGSIGVLEFLRDNAGAPYDQFPKGDIDQRNDGGKIHPHILDLKAFDPLDLTPGTCGKALSDNGLNAGAVAVEVDVGNSLDNNISPSTYDVKVDGKELTVGNVPLSDLEGESVVAVATFNIFPLHDGNSNITNLCLYDVAFYP